MPAHDKLTKINLLPQDEFDRTLLGKILAWALTAGKSIVILTEFVVILAFLARFKLDRDLNDLNEVVARKQAVVQSFSAVEDRMRLIQERIGLVGEVDTETLKVGERIDELTQTTPADVAYERVNFSAGSLTLTGAAGSEGSFARLLADIRNDDRWNQVSLSEVEFNSREGGVAFEISAREESGQQQSERGRR